ncbi:arylsulfatase [Oceanicoccus sp. KOV_DT_Chl]|uniref:arylsulfatase n=1 Tax=Oceanicoccus sp. KOV_DT_Chl TaxID=1904639 RepID=UPI000C7DD561|nr:arylsulfatase [Oceanicoccus sp. KOV_DT_Chl]
MGQLRIRIYTVFQLLLSLLLFSSNVYASSAAPSFLVIVADDMGWSDIGAFGSEIRTPALDALATGGVTMTNFYVAPTCSPTRAMLMTGVDSHLAGLGTMDGVQAPNQLGSRNYDAQLHHDVVTIAEGLKTAGYATLMSGKWHLGIDESQYPSNRGFDRSFALLEGGASHFGDADPLYRGIEATYLEDGLRAPLPEGFYSSIGYTNKMLDYIRAVDEDKPILAYVAYTAPHDPLQVPDDWLDKYKGVYAEGPAVLRAQRAKQLSVLGLVDSELDLWTSPQIPSFLPAHIKPWPELSSEEQAQASRPMEIYAAMIELMDQQIQRLIDELERSGRLDNTYVIFLSDNGPNGATPLSYPNNTREWFLNNYNHELDQQGKQDTHTYLGREWASAAAAPFKLYKGAVAEGGIRAPLIVIGPSVVANSKSSQVAQVTDLPATFYELASINPETAPAFEGKILPEGRSLVRNWQDTDLVESRSFATELFGQRAVVFDNWKATNFQPPLGRGKWELYDLSKDPVK